jgi:hypothetical protein
MSTQSIPSVTRDPLQSVRRAIRQFLNRISLNRGAVYGAMILSALIAFEIFNYGTTEFAFQDLLGDLSFLGVHWATILALAFCGIDFAGIARLFTPQPTSRESIEAWYLLAAWFLAATMNAMLTWWAVSLALLEHAQLGNEILDRQALVTSVPVFVAILVWLMRVLMIGTFTLAGNRLFMQDASRKLENSFRRDSVAAGPARMEKSPNRTWRPPSYDPETMVARPQARH